MKKIFSLAILMVFLVSANAMALTYTFSDDVINWPGQTVTNLTAKPIDEYGDPKLSGMTVKINDESNYLESVEIYFRTADRVLWDSLFINTGGPNDNNWQSWDYYVQSSENGNTGYLYDVSNGYTYTKALGTSQRTGHVNGIDIANMQYTDSFNLAFDQVSNGWKLTYNFSPGDEIVMGSNWTIGYTPDCANDVLLSSPVPEPATMMLLGLGLLGLAGVSRKRR